MENFLHVKISRKGLVEQIQSALHSKHRMTKNTRGNWKRKDEKRGDKSYLKSKRK